MKTSFLQFLQDPHLVASFQRCCGLFLRVEDCLPGNCSNSHGNATGNQGPGEKGSVIRTSECTNGNQGHQINGSYQYRHGQESKDSHGVSGCVVKEKPGYVVKNFFLYYLFRFAAALGQEIFYITFLPFTYWNFDPFVSRRLVGVWAIVMYLGQASKDIIKWPRPLSPPVVKLETRVDAEYGMPSTHAMAATAISFTFLIATMYRYKYSVALGLMASTVLSALVSLSRLYTGMHTVLDVICGILVTAVFMVLTYPFWNTIDNFQLTSPLTPVIAIVIPFFMSYTYPALDHYSPTRGDTTIILGVASGCTIGFWMNYQYGRTYEPTGSLPFELPSVTLEIVSLAIARFLVGIIVLVATRQVVKTLTLKALYAWFNVGKHDVEARKRLEIEVPYKFVTYSSIGFNATAVVPLLHQFLELL
ncbi:sphingosine-1-phosphate phosphatase 2 isoform X1 [Chiloscyllium plagiosum]|uniref:sphingosine-1-phosphate phosphatase 2 isoform X1 n=2 Tax=Chiloscyllium plagiosum TaxID=36176 RepID=UPI001CB7E49F|nr:sphingosine-1-phosphate phosphatase 2 isoform X1 [Chiloscyllium plagiosum]